MTQQQRPVVPTKTNIKLLRKGSRGIEGTYENADHHAKKILPIIEAMEGALKHLGFKEIKHGHNVHELVTETDQRYTLRPVYRTIEGTEDGRDYFGVRLSLRLSRSEEIHLLDIKGVLEVPQLLMVLWGLARGLFGKSDGLAKVV